MPAKPTMPHWKQLLVTLSCVAGILAIGACFGGGSYPPPPPPLRPLSNINSVSIEVSNASPTQNLSPATLANALADEIRAHTNLTPIPSNNASNPPPDAVLKIILLTERGKIVATAYPAYRKDWAFDFSADATLLRPNGQILWHRTGSFGPVYVFNVDIVQDPLGFTATNAKTQIPIVLSQKIIFSMMHPQGSFPQSSAVN